MVSERQNSEDTLISDLLVLVESAVAIARNHRCGRGYWQREKSRHPEVLFIGSPMTNSSSNILVILALPDPTPFTNAV